MHNDPHFIKKTNIAPISDVDNIVKKDVRKNEKSVKNIECTLIKNISNQNAKIRKYVKWKGLDFFDDASFMIRSIFH